MDGTTLTVLMDHIMKSTRGRYHQMKRAWTRKGGNNHLFVVSLFLNLFKLTGMDLNQLFTYSLVISYISKRPMVHQKE